MAYELAFESAWQMQAPRERFTRIERAMARLTVAIRPACIIAKIAAALVSIRLRRVTGATAERPRIIAIALV